MDPSSDVKQEASRKRSRNSEKVVAFMVGDS